MHLFLHVTVAAPSSPVAVQEGGAETEATAPKVAELSDWLIGTLLWQHVVWVGGDSKQ